MVQVSPTPPAHRARSALPSPAAVPRGRWWHKGWSLFVTYPFPAGTLVLAACGYIEPVVGAVLQESL